MTHETKSDLETKLFKEQATHCFDIAALITKDNPDVKLISANYTSVGFRLTFEYVDSYTYEVLINAVTRTNRL